MAFLDKWIRKLVPSASLLTHNRLFRLAVDAAAAPLDLLVPEFRRLPPNHLRIRVGVGNRMFANQMMYLGRSQHWLYAFASGWCGLDSTIVDLGCGCGRQAHHLRDLFFYGQYFRGRYYGVDIDREALDWCRKNFDADRFTFLESSNASVSYRREPGGAPAYRIPLPDASADYVFSMSLFTHLLEPELDNYLAETARILKPGRMAAHSVFCLDYPPPTLGGRHSFRHAIGHARVESREVPEAAVAYSRAFLVERFLAAGLEAPQVLHGGKATQVVFVTRKPTG